MTRILECEGVPVALHLLRSVSGCAWYSHKVLETKSQQQPFDRLEVLIHAMAAKRGSVEGVNGGRQNTFQTKMERNR